MNLTTSKTYKALKNNIKSEFPNNFIINFMRYDWFDVMTHSDFTLKPI